uniref:Uncharacterized protein n=1 Tax=Solanum lycopersicum TaxID=4081 RepID=K4AZV7_SOLLC
MEPKFLLSSTTRPFAPNGAFPFSVSQKSSFIQKTRICPVTHLAISAEHFGKTQILGKSLSFGVKNESICNLRKTLVEKTPFLGESLSFREKNESSGNLRKVPNFSITAAGTVKRRKELPFDNVIQRDKKRRKTRFWTQFFQMAGLVSAGDKNISLCLRLFHAQKTRIKDLKLQNLLLAYYSLTRFVVPRVKGASILFTPWLHILFS